MELSDNQTLLDAYLAPCETAREVAGVLVGFARGLETHLDEEGMHRFIAKYDGTSEVGYPHDPLKMLEVADQLNSQNPYVKRAALQLESWLRVGYELYQMEGRDCNAMVEAAWQKFIALNPTPADWKVIEHAAGFSAKVADLLKTQENGRAHTDLIVSTPLSIPR